MNAAAHWLTGRGTRRIWIAVLIVAVVAGVAAVVWVNRSPEEPPAGPATGGRFRISGRLDSAPVPRWTLRAADLSHEPGAVLLALPHSLDNYYGYGSPMDAGPIIVAATAVLGEPGPGTAPKAGPVRLHGIDPDTGAVRWTIDAGELLSCNERVFDGQLTCRGTHRVLIVDAATGTIATDRSTDFEVMDAAVRDGVVSVAGRTADWMTAVVTRGTVSDIEATWRRTYPTPVPGDAVRPRLDAPDYFRDGHDRNVRVYDLRTGDPLFTDSVGAVFDGGIIARQVIDRSGSPGTITLLDRNGHPLAEVGDPSFLLEWYPTATASPPPILTGESAYDRTTGRVLWTNPQIGLDEPTGRQGAVEGVVAHTVIVRSLDGTALIGLDLADGRQVWQQPARFTNTLRYDGVTDARHLILTDGATVHAIDARDGSTAWSMTLPPSGDPRLRSTVGAMGGRLVAVTAREFTGYATV
ncbi:PQQ-binding-like beta-propeller repeat protein [Nocardia elegans]|uniref:PQQ-binding-like beta-propeller repeat protein n=1 Tax=Nocardia elegans TaxID=300029 RepID=A0ABW6TBZ5_9NOCA|nr:PQQ-binding-like beta-propeller repeat protein [Nocardia elegans]MBF6448120.1 PQQ-binding-like beta-propeller repeat protein [Nocardia elegans]